MSQQLRAQAALVRDLGYALAPTERLITVTPVPGTQHHTLGGKRQFNFKYKNLRQLTEEKVCEAKGHGAPRP